MKIAITGATGFVGSHLAECLVARGHEVSCLIRDAARMRWIEGLPVRVVPGDLDSPAALCTLVTGQDVVVHSAGLTKARTLDEYIRVNVEGTGKLLAAIRAHAPRIHRFLYFSSQAVMGPSSAGAPLTEDVQQRPVSLYGKSKALAERSLNEYRDFLPITVIRPPPVYGPRDRDVLMFFKIMKKGIELILGGTHLVSVVYVKNLAHGVALAIERPMGSYRSYFFTDGGEPSWVDLMGLMAKSLGRKPLRVNVPMFAAAAVAGISGMWAALMGRPALLNSGKLAEMRPQYNVVSDERARTELGYRPLFSTEQGIEETTRWYELQGWL